MPKKRMSQKEKVAALIAAGERNPIPSFTKPKVKKVQPTAKQIRATLKRLGKV